MRHVPAILARLLPALLVLACASAPVQARVFINLTSIQLFTLSNGLRLDFGFDGTFQQSFNDQDLFDVDSNYNYHSKAVSVIRFNIYNARTQVGAFYDVSRYPVSHVEITVPAGAPEGIGLDVAIPLMAPARIREIDGENYTGETSAPPTFDLGHTQDRRHLIVTILSDRQQMEPEARKSEAQALTMRHQLTAGIADGLVSLVAVNADLRAVAAALNGLTGLRIVVDDSAQRIVNANLPASRPEQILDWLSRAYGLAPIATADGVLLTDATPHAGYRLAAVESRVVPLRYLLAARAPDLLPDFLRPLLRPSTDVNALVVTGSPSLIDKVTRDLERLDRPAPQVSVEVLAVDSSESRTLEQSLGLDFSGRWHASTASDTGDVEFATMPTSGRDLETRLHAVASRARVRIRARSHATLEMGQQAHLFVGQERFIVVGSNPDFGRQEGVLQQVDIGTTLDVQAWGAGDGPITVQVSPDISSLMARDAVTGLPVVQRRSARSTMRVSDGDTIVIGGLNESLAFTTHRKIPILGDLPLVGALFRSASHDRENEDLTIFVTVRRLRNTPERAAPDQGAPRSLGPPGKEG